MSIFVNIKHVVIKNVNHKKKNNLTKVEISTRYAINKFKKNFDREFQIFNREFYFFILLDSQIIWVCEFIINSIYSVIKYVFKILF